MHHVCTIASLARDILEFCFELKDFSDKHSSFLLVFHLHVLEDGVLGSSVQRTGIMVRFQVLTQHHLSSYAAHVSRGAARLAQAHDNRLRVATSMQLH